MIKQGYFYFRGKPVEDAAGKLEKRGRVRAVIIFKVIDSGIINAGKVIYACAIKSEQDQHNKEFVKNKLRHRLDCMKHDGVLNPIPFNGYADKMYHVKQNVIVRRFQQRGVNMIGSEPNVDEFIKVVKLLSEDIAVEY